MRLYEEDHEDERDEDEEMEKKKLSVVDSPEDIVDMHDLMIII